MSEDDRPILIIDALNVYLRAYAAYPQMSSHGYQMGGCVGFLKTIKKLATEYSPSAIYVAWEGGGSTRRRALYSEYKMNRKPDRLNRFYEDDIPDTNENKQHQIVALLALLKHLPVCQLYVGDCEADDVIAYFTTHHFPDTQKIIVSSDKDMHQLLNDKVVQYSPHKKRIITKEDVFNDYRITTENFALAKCLCGDPGDNVPGVKGLGFKTVAKKIPMLGIEQTVILQDVYDFCSAHIDEAPVFGKIIENWDDIKRNWNLVFLDGSMLSAFQATKIDHTIETFEPKCDKMSLIRLLVKEGINDFDLDNLLISLNCIKNIEYVTAKR